MGSLLSFQLQDFEAAVLADGDVLGMLYSGSLGRGTADSYSDLDIDGNIHLARQARAGCT